MAQAWVEAPRRGVVVVQGEVVWLAGALPSAAVLPLDVALPLFAAVLSDGVVWAEALWQVEV